MTSRDFCYWLQGFFEISKCSQLDREQVDMVKKHLNMAFKHEIDPSYGDKPEQDVLNHLHNNTPGGGPLIRC